MTPEEKERLEACLQEISSILYQNTPSEEIETLEGIEITVRELASRPNQPENRPFFHRKADQNSDPS